MNLQQRIDLLSRLGKYILDKPESWQQAMDKAHNENNWFIPEFIDKATSVIAKSLLQKGILEKWTAAYNLPDTQAAPKTVGIVMAGNIPLVGFHDLLCVFIAGHRSFVKPSSKDAVLIRHLADTLIGWEPAAGSLLQFGEMLKGCDAYIATGSNNSSGYFEYYFGKYPNIIRRNRTAVAILAGNETPSQLQLLADDVYLYFGRGCRNVTKLYVPPGYDFIPLLTAFKRYNWMADHHKYKNNYDYNLALHLLNKQLYMSTESILLVESKSIFSPISQLNYEFYESRDEITGSLKNNEDIQCIVGENFVPFGQSQCPTITDYADGVDTIAFLRRRLS